MKPKFQALASVIVSAVSGFIAAVAASPSEVQTGLMATLTECVPVPWRPQVAAIGKLIAALSLVYAVHSASKSGPQQPQNNPVK